MRKGEPKVIEYSRYFYLFNVFIFFWYLFQLKIIRHILEKGTYWHKPKIIISHVGLACNFMKLFQEINLSNNFASTEEILQLTLAMYRMAHEPPWNYATLFEEASLYNFLAR